MKLTKVMKSGKLIVFFIIIHCSFENVFPQGFVKITSGPVVNDSGWSYGACWGDFNYDGYLDLFVVNNMASNKNNLLYFNNGNGTFTKITSGIVVTDGGSTYGCSCADVDNDGDLDIFTANYGENNCLYLNNGIGTFTKVTSGAIVNDGGNSTGCAWGDYDNDGKVDLFVCNRNQNNFLYHNEGNGVFTKITSGAIVNDGGNSGGCAWGDYNNDGLIDLFVANAGPAQDFLYKNNGNGTFTKITNSAIVYDTLHSSGGSWGDYDNDNDLDLYVTGGVIGQSYNRLFKNNGNETFTKITGDPIVSDFFWSGGSSWGDIDNDGDIDLYAGGYDGSNKLYLNNGNSTFTRIDTGIIVTDGNYKMGVLWGDFDNDGDIDLFTARNNFYGGNNNLYLNLGSSNKWVNIRCIGIISNKSAIGAKVYARAVMNSISVRQMQIISSQSGGSISGQNSLNVEFGLGNSAIIDSIRIEWPSGIVDKYSNVTVNQFLTAIEGQSLLPVMFPGAEIPRLYELYQNYPNPFNPVTKIRFDIPVGTHHGAFVQIKVFDILGRQVATLVNEQLKPGTPACRSLGAGRYEVDFDGSSYASGVYFYTLITENFSETKRMVLIK